MFTREMPSGFSAKGAGAICFCEWQENILALKRSPESHEGGRWTAAPGGKLEPGETPLEAAVRETYEESGLRVDPKSLRYFGHFYANFPDTQYILYVFQHRFIQEPGPVTIRLDEHTEYLWLPPREVLHLPLMRGGVECIHSVYPQLKN